MVVIKNEKNMNICERRNLYLAKEQEINIENLTIVKSVVNVFYSFRIEFYANFRHQ